MRRYHIHLFIAFLFVQFSFAQTPSRTGASDILLDMERLSVLGSVLYFAAHPDDENTKLIAYLAAERKVRTAYLSLTRGDGGQNLIGTEQGIELGLIRTQELLQARKIDRGEQYFTSAFDFGFSKTFDETFSFWKKQDVLREAVWIIRKLQPDVIITRFPPDERGGHGHHQASAILAHEAFNAAADPNAFPEQLRLVKPWRAKRLLWNTANFMRMQGEPNNQLKIDIGQFNPLIGQSYGEISAQSRSQHKSQGFGSASSNGRAIESFEHVDGEKASDDLFDGIDLSWGRVPQGDAVQTMVRQLIDQFNPAAPQASISQLAQIWRAVQRIDNSYWKQVKTKEVEDLLLACAGIKIESVTTNRRIVEREPIRFTTEVVVRNPNSAVKIVSVDKQMLGQLLKYNEPVQIESRMVYETITQPYWLQKPNSLGKFEVDDKYFGYPTNPDLPAADIQLEISGISIQLRLPIQYRYVDPVRGEVHEHIQVVPSLTASTAARSLLIAPGKSQSLSVTFEKQGAGEEVKDVTVVLSSKGWKVSPEKLTLRFEKGQKTLVRTLDISNLSGAAEDATLTFICEEKKLKSIRQISYDHIPSQTWFPDVSVELKGLSLINPVKRVGYIMGAGDLIPEALRQLGTTVDILEISKINKQILSSYDAIVFGVRVLNVSPHVADKLPIVLDYARDGGVVVMQYNVNSRLQTTEFAPRPFDISRSRVTEEDADVVFLDPTDPALNYPNKITAADFDGWVQERGLYFAENVDPAYRTPLTMHDRNEPPHTGSLLIAPVGKGKFVYTSLSFFRQLPAGIPGATRLFVNLLAKEK